MKHKHIILVFLLLVLSTVLLWSNGQKEEAQEKSKNLKVVLAADWKELAEDWTEIIAEDFKDNHPNATVEFNFYPFKGFENQIVLNHNSGTYYDLIRTNHTSVGLFVNSGILKNIDDLVEENNIDLSVYNEEFLNTAYYEGNLYGIPFVTDFRVFASNMDILESVGYSEPPTTMEEMLEIAKDISAQSVDDSTKKKYAIIFDTILWYSTYQLGCLINAEGFKLYEKAPGGGYEASVDNPAALHFFRWVKEMGKHAPADWVSYNNSTRREAFASGRTAFYSNFGPWEYKVGIIPESDINYKLTPWPKGSSGSSGATIGGYHMSLGSKSENPELAMELLLSTIKSEQYGNLVAHHGVPPTENGYSVPPFNNPKYNAWREQLPEAGLVVARPIPEMAEIAKVWNDTFQEVILTDLTPEKAVKQAQAGIQDILDKR
jgi:ABC-type glycerol-3-phosphate transport system substrate-binding protein